MKKTLKRTLAVLLAMLFTLGVSMTAGAAPAPRAITRQGLAMQSAGALEILSPPPAPA